MLFRSILPVALHTNYKLLPDDGKLLLRPSPIRIRVLDPITPTSGEEDEVERLKLATFEAIQQELNRVNGSFR